jgi:UDP-N-acetylmuramoyl-tripeptide--D-alanyl-D-alanine ligase
MKSILKKIIIAIITWEAGMIIKKYQPQIIGVTGSVGKTSSKDAIFTVLRGNFRVRKSDKSFNSEIGIPLTILGRHNAWSNPSRWAATIWKGLSYILFTKDYPALLVLEIGADRPGDIEKVVKWLKPDVAVITRFGKVPVHVEYFDSPARVIEEKSHLAKALKPDGTLVLNHDDEDVIALAVNSTNKMITYGIDERADVVASNYQILYEKKGDFEFPSGIAFKVDYQGSSVPIIVQEVLGRAHLYPMLSAIAVGLSQNLNLVTISESLTQHKPPSGRMNIIEGIKNSLIIDDTYNSSPVALSEALETFKEIKRSRYKIAVLGDMLEIGKYSMDEHKRMGAKVAESADILMAVGLRAVYIAEGALSAGMSEKNIFQFEDSRKAADFLESIIEPGDIVLAKASQGVRMERVVERIMAHPELKEKLLVRQDEEWKKR